jgi:hypothetical protein
MFPGEMLPAEGSVELNADRETAAVTDQPHAGGRGAKPCIG